MLNRVPQAVSYSSRQVVLRHPNSMPCTVWRKELNRTETDPDTGLPSEAAGMATLGGMGVMRSEDESEFEYVELGAGRMLFVGQYQPADMVERDNGVLPADLQEALVECSADPGAPGFYEVDSGDVVFMDVGMGNVMPYEVVTVTGNIHIPPYTRKFVMNPRDDLAFLAPPFAG